MLIASAAMFTACSSDDDEIVITRPLSVEIDCSETRADLTTTSTLAGFKMYGADRTYEFKKETTGWTSDNSHWPTVGNDVVVNFYAYDGGTKIDGANRIDVTVDENAFEQKDILYAKRSTSFSETGETGKINLTFHHACAALNVSVELSATLKTALQTANKNITITSVTLNNVKNNGKFDLDTEEWSDAGGTANYTLTNGDITIEPTSSKIFLPCNYLFMIPQSLDGASFEVLCKVGTSTKTQIMTFQLDGKTLTQNKKETLNIVLQ